MSISAALKRAGPTVPFLLLVLRCTEASLLHTFIMPGYQAAVYSWIPFSKDAITPRIFFIEQNAHKEEKLDGLYSLRGWWTTDQPKKRRIEQPGVGRGNIAASKEEPYGTVGYREKYQDYVRQAFGDKPWKGIVDGC